jgi:hypothetical protein
MKTSLPELIIVTAASQKYAGSLLALIGSIRANWRHDLQIHVYNLGLSEETLRQLRVLPRVVLKTVPAFCPHWRLHYAWKLWILKNAESDNVLWLDAGIFVLKPLDNVERCIRANGLFLVPNYQDLAVEAPPAAVYSCDLTYAEISGRSSITANILGFDKTTPAFGIFERAFELCLNEANLKAVSSRHKHDQALMSCVLYSIYPDYLFFDGQMFAGWRSAQQVNGQQCWAQRRAILDADICQLSLRGLLLGGFIPSDPRRHTPRRIKIFNYCKSLLATALKRKNMHGVR